MSETAAAPTTDACPRRIAVIGGGISGLSAAHRLIELAQQPAAPPVEIELFEAGARVGGCFGSERIGEFLIETGADSFVTDKPWAIDLCRRLGLESRLIAIDPAFRRALIVRKGRTLPAPEGLALLAPARLGGICRSPLISPAGKLRVALEYFVPRRRSAGDESIASFARRRLGREIYERLVQPMVGGIYTGDPERLSLMATFPRFLEMEQRWGSLIRAFRSQAGRAQAAASGARYGLFASLDDGMSVLTDALRERIAHTARIHTGRRIARVCHEATTDRSHTPRFHTVATDGETHPSDAVILALPAHQAAELVADDAAQLAAALRQIEYASSAIVVTGHRLEQVAHPLDASGLVVPQREHRKILAVSFLSRKFPARAPAGSAILRTFVGGALQPELLECSDAALQALVEGELRDLLGVSGRPEFVRIVRHSRAMPQYTLGHLDRVQRIEALAAELPGLALAGNAYRGVGLPDCIHSGESAAERAWAQVAGQ